MTRDGTVVVAALGPEEAVADWLRLDVVRDVVRLASFAPSGKRLGKTAFGLGVDALLLAAKTTLRHPRGAVLATNPWIAVALRLLGRRRLYVTGLYATPASRAWWLFRRLLRHASVIATAEVEAERWRAAGGKAIAVRYGNTFGYPAAGTSNKGGVSTLFVGGSSDRDTTVLEFLERQVAASAEALRLVVAIGDSVASETLYERSVVLRKQRLPQAEFGRLMSQADVVVLPLVENARAAGHMLAVGALEVGVPVVATATRGMVEYCDGYFVRAFRPEELTLSAVLEVARSAPSRDETRAYWRREYSREAYLSRVEEAIGVLS